MEGSYDFSRMNETDVRETIARPFLHSLGYKQGTANNIRTEVPLRYPRKSLGRKKNTDPILSGRPDYVCDVVGHGSWILETKPPTKNLSSDDVDQAHSYAAHPEIGAPFFVLTNGRVFRVYATGKLDAPLIEWETGDELQHWITIQNVLGPEAVVRRARRDMLFAGKSLALGVGTSAEIVGGVLTYEKYDASDQKMLEGLNQLAGFRAAVRGDSLLRGKDGVIRAALRLAGPTPAWDRLNSAAGVEAYEFRTSDEYISSDENVPTIFQGMTHFKAPAGTSLEGLPISSPGLQKLPFDLVASAFTQATGYITGRTFRGTFSIVYNLELPPFLLKMLSAGFSTEFVNVGDFEINIVSS